ncbi:MAG TPA: NAD-dependent epimerase/dehydratase family protein [Symbiobacteriaceae bacterium]
MARILVTGAAGFIGSHLVRRLAADGHEVVAVDRRPVAGGGGHGGPIRWYRGDLLEMDLAPLVAGVEYVIHLAGQPGVRESWSEFRHYSRGNIETTQRLLEVLRGKPVAKFVLASTSSVYGEAPMPAREDGPVKPVSPYGLTKLAAEGLCELYGRTAKIPWVALRYFTVYGPGQRPDMAFSRWLAAARGGKPLEVYGDGGQMRDFTYVADAVEATVRALFTPAAGMAVNVGSGRPVSVREAIAVIEQVMGRPVQIRHLAPARGDMRETRADTTRLQRELGFVPATPLAEGLARQYEWLQKGGGAL